MVRLASDDVIVRNPGIWQFYDDYVRTLPPSCGADAGPLAGTLAPLWSRTLAPLRATASSGAEGGRSAVAVHPNGTVAVAVGGTLWLLDADSGVPAHGLLSGGGVGLGDIGTAVFTPDGKSLWVNGGTPTRLDLTSWDRISGPRAYKYPGDQTWGGMAPAVAADGTLFFLGVGGRARALETSGQLRWDQPGLGGTPRVDSNDRVFWSKSQPPRAVDALTGQEVWRAALQPEWLESQLLNSENAPIRSLVPMRNRSIGPDTVSLHRADGSIARVIELRTDGGVPVRPHRSAQSADGVLFLTYRVGAEMGPEWVERMVALDETTGRERWVRELSAFATDPVVGNSGDVYVAGTDCRLSILDPAGDVSRSYLMAGKPTGDLLQFVNGVLYVLTRIDTQLSPGERVFAGDLRPVLEDGGVRQVEDYDCPSGVAALCGPAIDGDMGNLFILYAFKVE